MTHPNPAGFYSLDMPESVEQEFVELDYVETAETLNEATYSLVPCGEFTGFIHLSQTADDWFDHLKAESVISLIRWLAERLDHLANEKPNAA
jgi:hypothetical protein